LDVAVTEAAQGPFRGGRARVLLQLADC